MKVIIGVRSTADSSSIFHFCPGLYFSQSLATASSYAASGKADLFVCLFEMVFSAFVVDVDVMVVVEVNFTSASTPLPTPLLNRPF